MDHFVEDAVGSCRPDKRLCVRVMARQIIPNRLFEVGNAGEGSATDAAPSNLSKEPLDLVQPARTGRRKVQHESWVSGEPSPDTLVLMGAVIVQDQVHLAVARQLGVDPPQEAEKLLMPVPAMTGTDDLPGGDVER